MTQLNDSYPEEVLVVVSKLKAYIKARSGMNTAGSAPAVLSERIRLLCDKAILRAAKDGRKTLMDRDFSMDDIVNHEPNT